MPHMARHSRFSKLMAAVRSRRGRDALMFMLFVAISAILWMVLSLNEEEQFDVRLPVRITHVPDSVTLIFPGPEAINVNLRARGTQVMKMMVGSMPTVSIDFRGYRSNGMLHLSSTELKALARTATGGSQVSVVHPDSIAIPYTTHPGINLPVQLDYKVTTGPRSALTGRPRLSTDTVRLFLAPGVSLPDNYHAVPTEPVRIANLDQTEHRRVRLEGLPGTRIIPDSIEVTFEVEPLIFKTRKVVIEPVNVPQGTKLITFPAQIDVIYMVPMSAYAKSDPHFRIIADYRKLDFENPSKMMKLNIVDVPDNLQNVYLSADSAEYIIEHR